MSGDEQLTFLKGKRDMCFDNMEGCDIPEFQRWEKLYVAYATIVDDMELEMNAPVE